MSKIKLKLIGVDEMLGTFSRFDKETRQAVRKVVKTSATRIRKAAQTRIRVDTGKMKKTIRVKYSSDGLSAEIGPNSPFAHLVEFGTTHSPAYPFMTPTAEEQKPLYVKDMEAALKAAVKNT
ncbi:HK97-gp10 family putative phage morphogenesis protein [Paenibacillus sp. HJGM_3]|uniref:HK97-gp10 family putative phage morphogenesis protein n=1 Tax=Paenibacillus sp. HJGM_3 TaxID=3379816 RepID=UPI00385EF85C